MFEDTTLPIYMQIATLIEDEILNKTFSTGDRVYSTNELSKLYTVNPATAGKGLNILIEEGILYKKRGVGMFVTQNAYQIIQEKRSKAFMNSSILSLIQEAIQLGIDKKTLLKMIEQYPWKEA